MSIEDNIFKKSIVDFNKLEKYGFKKEKDQYIYSENILDDTFKVIVEIDNKKINGKVVELALNEEYINFRIENIKGEFANGVKCEFEKILNNIKNNCFNEKYFIFDQTNRISNLIIKKYNSKPEFLWKKYPGYAVFRNTTNNKWFAIIMNILKNKIADGNAEIEIINVKVKEEEVLNLLSKNGCYEAYHMNKKNWISIILDDTLSDEEIMNYIMKSNLLTTK